VLKRLSFTTSQIIHLYCELKSQKILRF